jgi:hypothetical protein
MIKAWMREDGKLCCGHCNAADHWTHKRTFRAKATFGPAALLTNKKLKCQACGIYNKPGKVRVPSNNYWNRPLWQVLEERRERKVTL